MADPSLDSLISPTNAYTHDWMHGIFVDGVMHLCIDLVFESFIRKGYTGIYESFSDFLSHWHFPGRLDGNHLREIFPWIDGTNIGLLSISNVKQAT